jgi:hypothetical protein
LTYLRSLSRSNGTGSRHEKGTQKVSVLGIVNSFFSPKRFDSADSGSECLPAPFPVPMLVA